MFSLNHSVNLNKPELIITVPSPGSSSTFAGDLLVHNNGFSKVGFFYSKYLSPVAGVNFKGELLTNGELFFNENLNKLLLILRAGVASNLMSKFIEEVKSLLATYQISNIILLGSIILGGFNTDVEVNSKTINVYVISNQISLSLEKLGLLAFKRLNVSEEKKKDLEELDYVEGADFAVKLVKHFNKNKINFTYLLAFSGILFDPLAGFALYYKFLNVSGITSEEKKVPRLERWDDKFVYAEGLKFDEAWSFYLS